MKSLQLTKAAVVKPAITAVSIFYIAVMAFLIFGLIMNDGFYGSFSMRGSAQLFLLIFSMVQTVYIFKFSQNVCVSRKTCFLSAIYTIVGLSIITVILDMVIMGFLMIGGMTVQGYDMINIFFTIILLTSINIATASLGMLIGIAWYRFSKLVRICVGATFGALLVMGPPLVIMLDGRATRRVKDFFVWITYIVEDIIIVFANEDIWSLWANIGLAVVLVGIFYLVLRKAQITEMK